MALCETAPASPSSTPLFRFDAALQPQPGTFVRIEDGHLYYGAHRLRLWGAGGHAPAVGPDQPRGVSPELNAKRLREMGFNAFRLWGAREFTSEATVKKGEFAPYEKGDGSAFDLFDRFYAACKKEGIFLWITAPHYYPFGLQDFLAKRMEQRKGERLLDDDSFLAAGPDWHEWKQAIQEKGFEFTHVQFFDERLFRLYEKQTVAFLNHVNPYTETRYAEDEAMAILSLDNENAIIPLMIEQGIAAWPVFFQKQVLNQWNDWLQTKYPDEDSLLAAYTKLDEDERWGHLQWHPLLRERQDYASERAADLVEFVLFKVDSFFSRLRDIARAQAPSGVGVNVVPIVYNTQTRSNVPWLYTQFQSGVSSPAYYSYTMRSLLTRPPNQYTLEALTAEGVPTLLYEVNAGTPNPYRAEFPFRVATLACWQDWDGVFMHYWEHLGKEEAGDDQWTLRGIRYPKVNDPYNGLAIVGDPILTASYAMAGQIFLRHLLHPAPDPIRVPVRLNEVHSFENWNGMPLRDRTYARGTRIVFTDKDLDRDEGEAPEKNEAVASGDEILWDWPNGRLILDAPNVKAYIGKPAGPYRFRGGVTLSGINTPFVAWAMVSTDGQPLTGNEAAQEALILSIADAQNEGFVLETPPKDFLALVHSHPSEQAAFIKADGTGPAIQQEVGYTLSFPTLLSGLLTNYDLSLHPVNTVSLDQTNGLHVPPRATWMGGLHISERGEAAKEVVVEAEKSTSAPSETAPSGVATQKRWLHLPRPIPTLEVDWDSNYRSAHQLLRDSSIVRTDISEEDLSEVPDKVITLTAAEIWFDRPADVVLGFQGDVLTRITATFVPPPDWDRAVAMLSTQWGAQPSKNRRYATGSDTSEARWEVPGPDGENGLNVLLSEVQGIGTLTLAPFAH